MDKPEIALQLALKAMEHGALKFKNIANNKNEDTVSASNDENNIKNTETLINFYNSILSNIK